MVKVENKKWWWLQPLQEKHEIETNFRDKKIVIIVTKLEIILETNKKIVSKLVSIIVKWFIN